MEKKPESVLVSSPFFAFDSPDTQDHADQAVDCDCKPDTDDTESERVDCKPDETDAQSPHADDAHEESEADITGSAEDSAGDHGETEKDLRRGCDKEGARSECDDIRVRAEQVDDRTGEQGDRNAGENDDDRANPADPDGKAVCEVCSMCAECLPDKCGCGVGKTVGGQVENSLCLVRQIMGGEGDCTKSRDHRGQGDLSRSQSQALKEYGHADLPELGEGLPFYAKVCVKKIELNRCLSKCQKGEKDQQEQTLGECGRSSGTGDTETCSSDRKRSSSNRDCPCRIDQEKVSDDVGDVCRQVGGQWNPCVSGGTEDCGDRHAHRLCSQPKADDLHVALSLRDDLGICAEPDWERVTDQFHCQRQGDSENRRTEESLSCDAPGVDGISSADGVGNQIGESHAERSDKSVDQPDARDVDGNGRSRRCADRADHCGICEGSHTDQKLFEDRGPCEHQNRARQVALGGVGQNVWGL